MCALDVKSEVGWSDRVFLYWTTGWCTAFCMQERANLNPYTFCWLLGHSMHILGSHINKEILHTCISTERPFLIDKTLLYFLFVCLLFCFVLFLFLFLFFCYLSDQSREVLEITPTTDLFLKLIYKGDIWTIEAYNINLLLQLWEIKIRNHQFKYIQNDNSNRYIRTLSSSKCHIKRSFNHTILIWLIVPVILVLS